ncbi:MAG: hypothetical protein ACRC3Y_18115 [Romboutsia sp.]|uniref:hypothetical protein n=1 Tax=Romboutsia sp. TaxID=1965302 RepID=UPI003F2BF9F0
MEKKKASKRLVSTLKDYELELLSHCTNQAEGMSEYLKKLVRRDMGNNTFENSSSSDLDGLVAKKMLDLLFEKNYSLVAPSAKNTFKQEVNVSTAKKAELKEDENDENEELLTQDFDDDFDY